MKQSRLLLGLSVVLGILLLGGAAWTFAQDGQPQYVYGCIKDDSMRLVVNATDCKGQETAIGIPTEAAIAALEARITALEGDVAQLESLLQHFSRVDNEIYITDANLHVVNGTGSTGGPTNARGNIIIGYNELRGTDDVRTGSHMLIVGKENNYSSYGGIVVGPHQTASGPYASVSGGSNNTASAAYASVSGGSNNTASGGYASVSGGNYNLASGQWASVSGGSGNWATGNWASVGGGGANTASGDYASVGGGYLLEALEAYEFEPQYATE